MPARDTTTCGKGAAFRDSARAQHHESYGLHQKLDDYANYHQRGNYVCQAEQAKQHRDQSEYH